MPEGKKENEDFGASAKGEKCGILIRLGGCISKVFYGSPKGR
jgi:hypothetical protein